MTLEQAKVVGLFLGPWLCSYELRGTLNVKAGLGVQSPILQF